MKKENGMSQSTWRFLVHRSDFTKLVAARHISVLGDQIHTVTNMWLVQQLTGSALAMGSVFAANTIPRIIFSLVGGVSVDRYNKKLILIMSDVLRAFGVLVMALLALTNHLQVWHIALFAALNGAVAAFFGPAFSATVPNIVEQDELQRANALGGMIVRIASILGSALGGLIIGAVGTGGGYLVDAASYVLSALFIFSATIPKPARSDALPPAPGISGVWQDLKEGLRYILAQRALLSIVALSVAVTFVAIPVAQLLPSFAENALHLTDAKQVGFLWSGMTLGLFLGALFLNSIYEMPNKVLGVLISALLFGGGSVVFGLSHVFPVALGSIILMGFGLGLSTVLTTTLFQTLVAKEMLGRFFGNIGLLTLGMQPLVMWLAGFAADSSSAASVLAVLGSLLLIFSLFWMLQYQTITKAIRRQEQEAAATKVETGEIASE